MRIIAGRFKGRIIKFPNSKLVRPTTDKNKEAIFNYLVHSVDLDGMKVADIYAGSGSLGLEALSRGAAEIHFIEKDFHVSKMLGENINSLGANEECKVFRMDAVRFTKLADHGQYDLILADPPFFKDDIHSAVKNILDREFLSPDGIALVERSVQTKKKDEEAFGKEAFRRLGDSLIYLFKGNYKEIL
ncbi:MAG: 16S rRNA (guanine(966)-N(2))-methyltransferase RsmD [Ignavibacteriae bacterium HGW-Ignavibacteriae-3]|nr:MAG: 16S rRNA (guanine(966)-N(2))-methyltransferase RsmD [Ignavibacteriae bacterium HGW-Ignavibacteriae-3]